MSFIYGIKIFSLQVLHQLNLAPKDRCSEPRQEWTCNHSCGLLQTCAAPQPVHRHLPPASLARVLKTHFFHGISQSLYPIFSVESPHVLPWLDLIHGKLYNVLIETPPES